MRILYLCDDRGIPVLGTKGASTHVREITGALAARGHAVTLACARLGEGNPPPAVERILETRVAEAGEVRDLLDDTGADVVVERYSLRGTRGLRACQAAGVPLVLEVNAPLVHEASRHRSFRDVDAGLADERELFAGASAVTAVSRALVGYVAAVAPDADVRWVPNGVHVERFDVPPATVAGVDAGATVVGFVGSMKPWHGVVDLVAAFARVAPARPDANLVLVGTGPEEDAVRAAVPAGLSRRVHLFGSLPHTDVPGVVARFDVAVAPYRPSEDFYFCPLKVLEYLAAGRPVVYPPLGDVPELAGPGGRPFPPGDVGGLAAVLARLLDDPDERGRLARHSREHSRHWTWDRAAEAVERAVLDVVGAAAR